MKETENTTLECGKAAAPLSLGQDPEMISDFVLESHEHIQSIETHLLRLEKDSGDLEAIHAAFRAFHTMKGLAGFLDLEAIRELAHEVETVLDKARNAALAVTPEVIDLVLESADYLRRWLEHLETRLRSGGGAEPERAAALIARVEALLGSPAPPPPPREAVADLRALAETVTDAGREPAPVPQPVALAPEKTAQPAEPARQSAARPAEARSVKVDTGKLDHLVDTVGEMVIAQSLIQHDPELATLNRPKLVRNLGQLARITNEVQKTAMSMRMVPIGQLFQRMERVVRDLTRKTGKEAVIEISGEDTELDRNLVEELADPLMHMLRNSVDHDVEPAARRIERGKPPVARLRLSASHESGNIVIEVSDDGNGLDRDKILAKAVRNGLVEPGAALADHEIYNLIFQPGFSTAEQVTDVSGRGVGMDVVRRRVQKLRGRVETRSVPGGGTTFLLKLPLTLAIVEGLIVGVGVERYIVPLFAVREMLRPAPGTIFTVQDKGEMVMVRERLLPLVRLYQRFGVQPRSESVGDSLVIVAESATQPFAMLVDELIGKQEVVIKSLGPLLHHVPGISGGAILGDGRVGLILDLDRIFRPLRSSDHVPIEH